MSASPGETIGKTLLNFQVHPTIERLGRVSVQLKPFAPVHNSNVACDEDGFADPTSLAHALQALAEALLKD